MRTNIMRGHTVIFLVNILTMLFKSFFQKIISKLFILIKLIGIEVKIYFIIFRTERLDFINKMRWTYESYSSYIIILIRYPLFTKTNFVKSFLCIVLRIDNT